MTMLKAIKLIILKQWKFCQQITSINKCHRQNHIDYQIRVNSKLANRFHHLIIFHILTKFNKCRQQNNVDKFQILKNNLVNRLMHLFQI